MTGFLTSIARWANRCPLPTLPAAAAALLIGWSGEAGAQDRLYVDTSLTGGVSTNPFFQVDPTPTTASATIAITPVYVLDSPLTHLRIVGDARVTEYASRYRTNDSYSIRGIGDHQLSETVFLNAELSLVDSVVGSFSDVPVPVAEVGPPTELPTFIDDPAVAGVGRRRYALQALGGLAVRLSPYDQVSARISTSASRYANAVGLDEYNSIGGGASYSRTISQGFTASGNLGVQRIDYRGGDLGDSTILQPNLSVTRTWSASWTLTASAGVAITRQDVLFGKRTSTAFNGAVNACRQNVRWNACVGGSRSTVPSSVQGVRTQTGAMATFGYRVSERDTLSIAASYSHADAPLLLVIPTALRSGAVDFLATTTSYSRRISPRLSAVVSGGFSKSYDDKFNRDANIEGRFGLQYRFGEGK